MELTSVLRAIPLKIQIGDEGILILYHGLGVVMIIVVDIYKLE